MSSSVAIELNGNSVQVRIARQLDGETSAFLFSQESIPPPAVTPNIELVPPVLRWMASVVTKAGLYEVEKGDWNKLIQRCEQAHVGLSQVVTPDEMKRLSGLTCDQLERPDQPFATVTANGFWLGKTSLALAAFIGDPEQTNWSYDDGPISDTHFNSINYWQNDLSVRIGAEFHEGWERIFVDNDSVLAPTTAEMITLEGSRHPNEITLTNVLPADDNIIYQLPANRK